MLRLLACVFVGSGLGGALRYLISVYMNRWIDACAAKGSVMALFPWPTFMVNIVGCFLIGLIYGVAGSGSVNLSPEDKTFLTAGFCGGLTTFSTFSHENYLLFESHSFGIVAVYSIVSIILGFGSAWLGHAIIK